MRARGISHVLLVPVKDWYDPREKKHDRFLRLLPCCLNIAVLDKLTVICKLSWNRSKKQWASTMDNIRDQYSLANFGSATCQLCLSIGETKESVLPLLNLARLIYFNAYDPHAQNKTQTELLSFAHDWRRRRESEGLGSIMNKTPEF